MSLLIDRICAADRGKTNVLVVDDVLPILEEMLTLLELTDIPVVAASSLDEAVLALEECQNISVVVCDVYLGKESGLDLIERARAVTGRELDYVFVTGDPMGVEHFPDGMKPAIVTKPVRPRELIDLLKRLLENRRQE